MIRTHFFYTLSGLVFSNEMGKITKLLIAVLIFYKMLVAPQTTYAKTFYLDGSLASNCISGNYSIANRTCSGTDGNAYNNLQDASNNLAGGDTLYVRSGTYIRTTSDTNTGSFVISASGTASQHTVVSNYGSEQPVICTAMGKCQYNPNPGDTTYTACTGISQGGSNCYYPNPAISIGGNYIDVSGFKTFGQVLISSVHDVTLSDCDLGGGGPHINQGSVVMINAAGGSAYNVTIRNNKIHHSCWGEHPLNGSAVMGYNFTATIENNEFYDNWGCDIRFKDMHYESGKSGIVRFNFFKPSSIYASKGVCGGNQYMDADNILVYNNVFYNKSVCISWDVTPAGGLYAYNNTFVNCTQDTSQWLDGNVYAFNNIHYHTNSNAYHANWEGVSIANINANYNIFYSSVGDSRWKWLGGLTNSFSAWQNASGEDANSLNGVNPYFVNAGGNQPSDFRRNSYNENMTGSPYGIHAGAYETGFEIIGLTGGVVAKQPAPPSPPSTPR